MRVFESIPFRSAENVKVDAEPEREKGDKFLSVSYMSSGCRLHSRRHIVLVK